MDIIATVKVKAWGDGQGEFVEINADDFNPDIHTPFDALDHDGSGRKGGSLPRRKKVNT
ncbi:MAG TPA: hypothetical protein VJM34_09460 [Novosphingobium sp.]|nr:hypothetical protein [Novosphingobium sp.]